MRDLLSAILANNATSDNITLTSLSISEKRNIYIYIIEGAILSAFNLPVAVIILFSVLRQQKEYVIIAGMVTTDFVFGTAFVLAGMFRIMKGLNRHGETSDQWECASTPHNIIAVFISSQIGLMAFIISVDRLLSVSIPFRYSSFSTLYAWALIGISIFISTLVSILSLCYVYLQKIQPQISGYCIATESFGPFIYRKIVAARLSVTFLSVILYIPIMYKMREVLNHHDCTVLSAKQRRKLRRITISACLYAINTLVLFNLPDMIIFINPGDINKRASICYILLLNRGVFNIFIYTIRHRELWHALMSILGKRVITSGSLGHLNVTHQAHTSTIHKSDSLTEISCWQRCGIARFVRAGTQPPTTNTCN